MISRKNKNGGLVYSTEFGKACPKCGKPQKNCSCGKKNPSIPSDGIVRISRQT